MQVSFCSSKEFSIGCWYLWPWTYNVYALPEQYKQKNRKINTAKVSIVLLTRSFFLLDLKCFYNPFKVLKHTCFPSLERLWTKKKPLHCLRTTFYNSNKLQQNNFQRPKQQSSIERSVYLSKSIKVIQIQLSREAVVRRYSSE